MPGTQSDYKARARSSGNTTELSRGQHRVAAAMLVLAGPLLAFDDLRPFAAVAGGLGKSPAWIPLVIAAFALPPPQGKRAMKIERGLTWLWLFGCASTLTVLLVVPPVSEQDLFMKTIRVGINLLVFIVVVRTGLRASDHLPKFLILSFILAFAALTCGTIGGRLGVSIFDFEGPLHATPNFAQRIRGTRFEASSLGAGLLTAFGACALALRSRRALLLASLVPIAILVFTDSRGSLACALAITTVCVVTSFTREGDDRPARRRRINVLGLLLVLTCLVPAFALSALVTSSVWSGMSASLSDATRSIWAQASLSSLFHFPIGQGFAGPSYVLQPIFAAATEDLAGVFSIVDLEEATNLAQTTDLSSLSPKTLPAVVVVYFGAPGLVALVTAFWTFGVRAASPRAPVGYAVAAFALVAVSSSYFSSPFAWDQALLLGALLGAMPAMKTQELKSA